MERIKSILCPRCKRHVLPVSRKQCEACDKADEDELRTKANVRNSEWWKNAKP